MRLHLGCGVHLLPGWVNIDQHPPCDRVLDLREPLPYADGSVEAIFTECLICYFSRTEWRTVLADWARVLAPGGTIGIVEHAADAHMRRFLEAPSGQRYRDFSTLALWGDEHYGWYKWGATADTLQADCATVALHVEDRSLDPLTLDLLATHRRALACAS